MPYGATGRDRDDAGVRPPERGGAAHGRRRAQPEPARGRTARSRAGWRAKSTLAKAGYVIATLVAVVAVTAGIGAFALYRQLAGGITKVKVGHLSGRAVYGAQNILVLGSQERLGQHGNFGYEANPGTTNSDNLLLVHLDPTHTHATVLSIPRDLFAYEPACKERKYIGTGTWPVQSYPPGAIIDGALNIGGPTCAVATVEDLTGIKLDHFVEFNFNSFRTMVDTIGGVEVCVPPGRGYHDHYSHLNLSPGKHLLMYNQALAYVRTRHGVGSGANAGGDLPRIQLQQAFISSVVQKVQSNGLLSNLPALYGVAKTATKALTVDDGLGSVTSLLHLAQSLAHLRSRDVSLITLPTTMDTYPGLQEHLMAVQPQDDVLFQMARTGQAWRGQLPVEPFSNVQVRVLNGTGQTGLARRTAARLRTLGFDVTGVGDVAATTATTVDYAGLDQADDAYTLMTALKSFPAGQNTLAEPAWQVGRPGAVTLILGTNFAGVNPPTAPVTHPAKHRGRTAKSGSGSVPAVSQTIRSGPGAIQSRNAGASICSGLPPAYRPGATG
jgi:LCP family protein required for cell wall assembly